MSSSSDEGITVGLTKARELLQSVVVEEDYGLRSSSIEAISSVKGKERVKMETCPSKVHCPGALLQFIHENLRKAIQLVSGAAKSKYSLGMINDGKFRCWVYVAVAGLMSNMRAAPDFVINLGMIACIDNPDALPPIDMEILEMTATLSSHIVKKVQEGAPEVHKSVRECVKAGHFRWLKDWSRIHSRLKQLGVGVGKDYFRFRTGKTYFTSQPMTPALLTKKRGAGIPIEARFDVDGHGSWTALFKPDIQTVAKRQRVP